MDSIIFSYNWNKKLDCLAFTTFRLHNDKKYQIGQEYKILEGSRYRGTAQIVDKKTLYLSQVNEFIAQIDTGYSLGEFIGIVEKMYGDLSHKAKFDLILLKYV